MPALRLHASERRQVRSPIDEVVNLHEIDGVGAQQRGRAPHLLDPGLAPARPHFGGEKHLGLRPRCCHEIARHRFRLAIHW